MSIKQRRNAGPGIKLEVIQAVFLLIAGLLVSAGAYLLLSDAGVSIELTGLFAISVLFGAMVVGGAWLLGRKKPRESPEVEFRP
ncbi:hypothetical protein [Haloarchaeobius sp. HME9146]|uniref:hypothetical protein n=1 Tax=unclassified Haloarchaeobius TaxID=2614452 RepID=UPI0021C0A0B3|nr:hypothetical protein [Haloarchaeobius sp. HME9146]MCT9094589.1 hypothetical protein [Haloarchaeobius sp. HME9146]